MSNEERKLWEAYLQVKNIIFKWKYQQKIFVYLWIKFLNYYFRGTFYLGRTNYSHHTLIFSSFADLWYFKLWMKYLKLYNFSPSGCKYVGVRKLEFEASNQIPYTLYSAENGDHCLMSIIQGYPQRMRLQRRRIYFDIHSSLQLQL